MASVSLTGVSKSYGAVTALRHLDLQIADGEFLSLLGPSGCGKTTTLRLIAGFVRPTTGTIRFAGDDVTRLPPQSREIGMVFQDYALFPHMTIAENIGFGLVERRRSRKEIETRVFDLLQLIRLPGVENRHPGELSGGQQQRVAVARAVAHAPRVLLMDEPLGALDLKLREAMQTEIRRIQQALRITTIYVTHDQTEAMNMSDRIAVMNGGAIEQLGAAEEIYRRPRTRFVADFVGQTNLLPATLAGRAAPWAIATVAGRTVMASPPEPHVDADGLALCLRPEQLSLSAAPPVDPEYNHLPGKVLGSQFAGPVIKVRVDVGAPTSLIVDAHPNAAAAAPGTEIFVSWRCDAGVLLPAP